jgi:hypothetical protein
VENIKSFIQIDPSIGVRNWLQRQDIVSEIKGEVIEVSVCHKVKPKAIYWQNSVNGTCYKYTPVLIGTAVFFINPGSRDLVKNAPEIDCSEGKSIANITSVEPPIFPFNYRQVPIVFNASGPHLLSAITALDSLSVLSSFSNRINDVKKVFTEHNIVTNDTSLIEDLVDTIQDIKVNMSVDFDPIGKVTNLVSEYKQLVIYVSYVLLIFIIISALIYFYPWIKPIISKCRPGGSRSGEYRVNNITAPSAPEIELEERAPNILSYIPQSYMCWRLQDHNKMPIFTLDINDMLFTVLLDSGSSISFCSSDVAAYCQKEGAEYNSQSTEARVANGTTMTFSNSVNVDININGLMVAPIPFPLPIKLFISDFKHPVANVVLGSDFIRLCNRMGSRVSIDLVEREIKIGNGKYEMLNLEVIDEELHNVLVVNGGNGQLPRIKIKLNGIECTALVDTGASITYCKESLAKRVSERGDDQVTPVQITGRTANGSQFNIYGQINPVWEITNKKFIAPILISQDNNCPYDLIIGTDLIGNLGFKIDFTSRQIEFVDRKIDINNIEMIMRTLPHANVTIRASETIELDKNTDTVARGIMDPDSTAELLLLISDSNLINTSKMISVGKTLCSSDKIFVRLLNPTQSVIKIYKGEKIAQAEIIDEAECEVLTVLASIENEKNVEAWNYVPPEADVAKKLPNYPGPGTLLDKLNLGDAVLSIEARKKLKTIIANNNIAFVGSDGNIGHFRGNLKHRIELIDPAKVACKRPYRVPPALREEVEKQISEMLRQRIIRPSMSSFSSPIVLVKKADGKSWRFAIDYRELNANTRREVYYLPLISDIIDEVGGKRIFSTFDMQSGFHQLDVAPEHIERTAFATFLGLFEYIRMPFGLCGGPSSFQRMMEIVRKELSAAFFVYLDDVILASLDEEQHLQDIDSFLKIIIKFGLKLRIDKCNFGRSEIKYLGYLISEAGVRPDPRNIAAVQKFEKPKTITQLRSFLGAVSYFRRFIRNFAGILVPLYELTRDNGTDINKWSDVHDKAFKTVITALTTAPVLASPKFGEPFIIESDASKIAVGGCLLQVQADGLEHPILFVSRKLNKHEAKYPSVESEALGMIFCLKEFRPYIEGNQQTTVRTDNSALRSLFKRRDLEGRLAKYQLVIQEYNINIEYKKGKDNVFSDYLSRYPAPINQINIENTISDLEIKQEQKNVKFAREMFEALTKNIWPKNTDKWAEQKKKTENFTIINGIIFKKEPLRMFIPYKLRERIIKIFHSCPLTGGHLGIQKTTEKLTSRFWWQGIVRDIKGMVTACSECQARKVNPAQTNFELTKSINPATRPFSRVHCDLLGPLIVTNKNNKYILGIIDSFSKWLVTVALEDQTAITVAEAFLDTFITKFGVMETLITDNGRQFTSQIFSDLSKIYNYEHIRTTAYRPQTNGQIERENATVANMLSTYVNKNPKEWDLYLSAITFAYNTSIQSSTAFSPFYLIYGQDPKFPTDLSLKLPNSQIENSEVSMFAQDKIKNLRACWDIVRENLLKAQVKQKEFKDVFENAATSTIQELDLVLLYKDFVKNKTKFSNKWAGPFRVLKILTPNATLQDVSNEKKIFKVHINKLKKYTGVYILPFGKMDELEQRNIPRNLGDPNLEVEDEEEVVEEEELVDNLQ